MFGPSETEGTFRLFGTQRLSPDETLSVSFMQGFPNYVTEAAVELDGFPCGEGRGRVVAGDFSLAPLQPPLLTPVALDTVPLVGLSFRQRHGDRQAEFFFGRPEYPFRPPSGEFSTPWLAGGRWLDRYDRNWLEFALTAVDRPTYLTRERRGLDAILSGMLLRELSPWVSVFGELQGNAAGSVAGRLGVEQKLQRGDVSASLYGFGRNFPFIYPLYRPGETGLEVSGRFDPSELSAMFATIDLVDDPLLNKRREVRGSAGVSRSFGTNRPSVTLTYSRNELVFDPRSIADRTQFGNRLSATVSSATSADLVDLTVEKLWGAGGSPDRAQAVLDVRRVVGLNSLLTGWTVLQKEAGLGWGVTSEGTLEFPARGRLFALAGLGAAFLDRSDGRTAQGEVVLGLSRRLLSDGLNLRFEVRLPFDVGVPSSRLLGRQASLDLGYRLGWRRLDQLFASVGLVPPGMQVGTLEGTVVMAGRGLAGVRILIDLEPRATTRSDGSFRATGVTAGRSVAVQVDPASLEPRVSVIGGGSREVTLAPRGVARVRFELAEFSYFQGSVVTCEKGPLRAVAGATVTLQSATYSATEVTNTLGGFQFDGIPPGPYRVSVDAGQARPALPPPSSESFQLDLSQDVAGFVIRLRCAPPPRVPGS